MDELVLTPFEVEKKIGEIAMQAATANLSLKTTKTMVSTQYAAESEFVRENLGEILETIDNIFKVLNRK